MTSAGCTPSAFSSPWISQQASQVADAFSEPQDAVARVWVHHPERADPTLVVEHHVPSNRQPRSPMLTLPIAGGTVEPDKSAVVRRRSRRRYPVA